MGQELRIRYAYIKLYKNNKWKIILGFLKVALQKEGFPHSVTRMDPLGVREV